MLVMLTHGTQDSGFVDRDLNKKPSEYEAGAVPFRQRRFGGTWSKHNAVCLIVQRTMLLGMAQFM